MKRLFLGACLVGALWACGEGVDLPPAPMNASDDDGGTTTTGAGMGGAPGVVPKREVYQRNPFGNVAATGNLLWDGDFEWRPPFAGQYGWYQAESPQFDGLGNTKQIVGPSCRSGIKCAELEPNNILLGFAVASEGNELDVSFWAYPDNGDCTTIEAALINQESGAIASEAILSMGDSADADGWCRFESVVAERSDAQWLYIHNASGTMAVIIDDAVIVPATSQQQSSAMSSSLVMDPDIDARLRAFAQQQRKPRILPKSAGEIAWEKHLARRWRLGTR
jgi:hypothetical protein